ncbi:site-specific integrase [Rufibacter sp. XAAS-G3-1]|uniref:tyrosine-type recombinase/integrase n=1 Tax=Rufibacter sp. XAAS-G3-1 TaxID=2729134 RepID=UPI001C62A605|nr:site-specific integrase [Rufibacter sp. XAAS-G3-1]
MKITKVKLRTKAMLNNRESVRLDYYPPIPNPETGKLTRFEYTGLYYFTKPRTVLERTHNKETKALAENLRAQRQLEVQAGQLGFLTAKDLHADFIAFFRDLKEKRDGTTQGNWTGTLNYLVKFFGMTKPMKELSAKDCEAFREFLLTYRGPKEEDASLSQNTAGSYYGKFKSALKLAFKEGHLLKDLDKDTKNIKAEETEREFLTLEELKVLASTPCKNTLLRKAALFSALTGLRYSDIEKLTWPEIQHSQADGYSIRFRQKKTKGTETLPISEEAVSLLGERSSGNVFEGLSYSRTLLKNLKTWVEESGIPKHITFHCFRHTYATLQISMGTDLYTVSKLLGHRDLKTTQVYAKVMDKAKQEAAGKIKLLDI